MNDKCNNKWKSVFIKCGPTLRKNAPFWFLGLLHQLFLDHHFIFVTLVNFSRETAECQKYYFEGYGIKFNF